MEGCRTPGAARSGAYWRLDSGTGRGQALPWCGGLSGERNERAGTRYGQALGDASDALDLDVARAEYELAYAFEQATRRRVPPPGWGHSPSTMSCTWSRATRRKSSARRIVSSTSSISSTTSTS
jgi:hypothetical protein